MISAPTKVVRRIAGQYRPHRAGGPVGDDLQVVEEVASLPLVGHLPQVHLLEHQAVDPELLVDAADHGLLLDGLVLPADVVVVEIHIQVVHGLHRGQGDIGKEVVHIKGMLRELQTALAQELRAVDEGVHEQVLPFAEAAGAVPAQDPVPGEGAAVADDLLVGDAHFVIDVVADEQVHRLLHPGEIPQDREDAREGVRIHPVVAVHHLEVEPHGIADAGHHRAAVAGVLLVDGPDGGGVGLRQFIGDGGGAVFGAVVHDEDLDLLTAGQQRLHTVAHIVLGVVAGYRHR